MQKIVTNAKFVILVLTVLFVPALPRQVAYGANLQIADYQQTVSTNSPQPIVGPDRDGDWVSDADEEHFGSDPSRVDTDKDGMSDFEEVFIWATAPDKANLDSDRDGIFDEIEKTLFKTNPEVVEPDRDGDMLFDQIELDYQTDPGNPDTDGDLLSDFLEIFLTKSDPRVADPDNDNNGYPDVIQPWLPQLLQDSLCQADVTLAVNALTIVDAEEADSLNNVVGGDEAVLMYALQIALPTAPDRPISQTYFDQKIWRGTVVEGNDVTRFQQLKSMSAQCGEIISIGLQALEDDAPWGGVTDMGFYREDRTLFFRRIPMGWEYNLPLVHTFQGVGIDGSYQYDVHYTLEVALGSVPLARQGDTAVGSLAEASPTQPLTLGIGLFRANGTETQPLGRVDTQPTAVISGTQLTEEMSVTFTPDFALVELLPGDYIIQVNAPPYSLKEMPFTLEEDYQRLLITLERPPLAFENLVLLEYVGRTLVDYETGEIATNLYNGNGRILFRNDLPNAYVEVLNDSTNVVQKYIDGNQTQALQSSSNGQGRLTSVYLAPDLQRVVYVVTNDLWLAEIDWRTLQLVNERQITHNGIFQHRVYYYSWYEDAILANVQNRMVRIDLTTGTVNEAPLAFYRIEERLSPDGRIALSVTDPLDGGYDLLTDEQIAIPGFADVGRQYTFKWLTNTRFALQTGEGAKAQIFIYDRDGNTLSLQTSLQGSYYYTSVGDTLHTPSPSGTYFFAWGDRNITDNVLINSESATVIAVIPKVLNGNIHWIDDTRFFFSRGPRSNFGDVKLEDQGTWLYDISTATTTKVSSYPYTSMVVLPEKQVAVFTANDNLWRMKFDDFVPVQITTTGRYGFTQVKAVQTVNLTGQSK